MKKKIFYCLIVFFFSSFLQVYCMDDEQTNSPFIYEQQIIREFIPFLKKQKDLDEAILDKLLQKKDLSLSELNAVLQKFFLRPKGFERLSPEAFAHYKKLCAELDKKAQEECTELFRKIGDIEPVYPKLKTTPDYILIQGSTVPNMRERVMFLAHLITDKLLIVSPETQIVFLAGERPLFSSETKQVLLDTHPYPANKDWCIKEEELPTDERQAAEMVWAQLELPDSLRNKCPIFVKSLKKVTEKRAQTEDCVTTWIQDAKPKAGLYIIISSNPFVSYQTNITKLKFWQSGYKEGFIFEGVGPGTPVNEYPIEISLGLLMDNLARRIYVENEFRKLIS